MKMIVDRRLTKAQFQPLIPHVGVMNLIDMVESWADNRIVCRTRSHLQTEHPLRLNGQLSAIHLLEYGAQAMAIHGGLLHGKALPGYLAAVRGAQFYIENLDDVAGDLIIKANAELKIQNGAVYRFTIMDSADLLLVEARATVINTL